MKRSGAGGSKHLKYLHFESFKNFLIEPSQRGVKMSWEIIIPLCAIHSSQFRYTVGTL
jgi:hypothetical protein